MVYESDFYTTRRPYSRPLVSSYSITKQDYFPWEKVPFVPRPSLVPEPFTVWGRKRQDPKKEFYQYVTLRDKEGVVRGKNPSKEDHARQLVAGGAVSKDRPITLPISTILQYFDDEAREIRARVDSLLRRVHIFVPRAVASDFAEEIVPERMRSGDYVRRLLSGKHNMKKDSIEPISWYEVPDRGNFGNLACVKYVAGKPHSIRKPYFKVADLRPSDIKNDVNFLSYYSKNREAAANALRQDKEEAAKRIEQYLINAAEQARTEEERKIAAEEERTRLELEEAKAWEQLQIAQERVAHLDEIIEQEKTEEKRKAEEEKIEADLLETRKILEEERKLEEAKTAALLAEQERMLIEEQLEKTREEEEKEERLANVTFLEQEREVKSVDPCRDDEITCDVTDQDREEKPYDPITDDETQIEEEEAHEECECDMAENPFVEEPEGAEGKAVTGGNSVEESSKTEEATSGGEESFVWGDEED